MSTHDPETAPTDESQKSAVAAQFEARPRLCTLIEAWSNRVRHDPDSPALVYFDNTLSVRQADDFANALAVALAELGVGHRDRVGIHLQNIPQYALVLLALWKLGATALLINPMYRGRELRELVTDAEPLGIITTDHDVQAVRESVTGTTVRWVLGTAESDLQSRDDPRVFGSPSGSSESEGLTRDAPATTATPLASPEIDLLRLADEYIGKRPPQVRLGSDDLAFLAYTSGTTGPPKGAMNTHANVLAVTTNFARLAGIAPGDVVFALAPLFHITGAVVIASLALTEQTTLVFAGRFQNDVAVDAMHEHRVTYTIGSITAFNAIMNSNYASAEHFSHVKTLFSGGAPVPPSTVVRFQERFGHYIHNAYGMTETSSAVAAVPPGTSAPVDPGSGTLSIGRPLPGVKLEVIDSECRPLPPGHQGELVITAPQVVSGYWRKPMDSDAIMLGGRLRSGDSAIVDEHGWVYLVDRIKDQINVSGYKVWPREVEDVLHAHPAVLEAAVVGVPDEYRGESVAAYISLRDGHSIGPDDLLSFARERLAPYKRPRTVKIVAELPKTQTGKIRRRALRDPELSS
ncbi:long-chain fatty acid--CoA ligase [Rhodococcus sp. ABRD24]|uniref:class I adenylate-forming enzyme family protein n=1 Tax=Rhodococcus sp. ABRD24 TaxID=2507582 RepID=UPI00103FF583|nr:AMP-binding protein [Rhodococcus sp. ABRD24]QBJ96957.1 long-chain fatty acid--CoA ligase [Rhodococcus sp. ABRD24]